MCVFACACACALGQRLFLQVFICATPACLCGRIAQVKQTWLRLVSSLRMLTGGRREEAEETSEGSGGARVPVTPFSGKSTSTLAPPSPLFLPTHLRAKCDSPTDSRLWPRFADRVPTFRHPSPLTLNPLTVQSAVPQCS